MTTRTIALGLTLFAVAAGANAQQVTLKVHHFLSPTSTVHAKMITPWCDKLKQDSGGRIVCQIYPAMQLGGTAVQLMDQAKDGVVDVIWTVTGYTPGRFTRMEVFELPFLMTKPEATARAMWEFSQTAAKDEFKDVKPIAIHPHGPGAFHVVKHPVNTLADFKDLKLRVPTRQTNKMLTAFGGTPVGIPMPQVPESISKGVIDGALMPFEVVPAVKVNELVKFHSETDTTRPAVYTTVLTLTMNKARYDGLPPELKKVIDANSGPDVSASFAKAMHDADIPGRQMSSKNKINVVPAAEIDKWIQASQPVIDAWVAEVKAKGIDGQALLSTARALTEKYNKQ